VLFAGQLHSLCQARCPNISAFAVHPGVVDTGLYEQSALIKCFNVCCGCCMKSPEQGAASSLHCALAKGLRGGEYYDSDCTWREMNPLGRDKQLRQGLWALSEKLAGLEFKP
jgi:hypothetical protein